MSTYMWTHLSSQSGFSSIGIGGLCVDNMGDLVGLLNEEVPRELFELEKIGEKKRVY